MSRRLNGKQDHSGPGGVSGAGVLDAPSEVADGYSIEELAEFMELAADYMQRISVGDIPPKITAGYRGTCNKMKNALNDTIDLVHKRANEVEKVLHASKEGRLDYRADSKQFSGANGRMFELINEILDAILLPIGEGNRILAQISAGKIDELIAQTYKGDHEKMKQAVNNVAIVLQGLQKELARLKPVKDSPW